MPKNAQQTPPHWVEKVAFDIFAWQKENKIQKLHVDDMKTPSGRVHTGALRGVILHDIVAKKLLETKKDIVSTYVFNDMDAMDGLPAYLDAAKWEQYMGVPLCRIPAPTLEESGLDVNLMSEEEKTQIRNATSFAQVYAFDFINAFRKLGCSQELVWTHELYEKGQFDPLIKHALDNVDKIRSVYEEVAKYSLPPKWLPIQIFCENCGKLSTTLATDWDGKLVTYECQPNRVKWTTGCGHTGKVSPFGGTAKMPWKVEWPAHWMLLGITIEGAGKDHTSAGGSRDMANHLMEKVFDRFTPFDVPYEWILIRGTKMSSSKGVGTSAREFVELFPTEVGRFLFLQKQYGQVIDFDPHESAILDLFDDYDHAARVYWKEIDDDSRMATSFKHSQVGAIPQPHFLPRFRDLAIWMQYPEIDLVEKFAEIKGSALTAQEKEIIEVRKKHAQLWLEKYADEKFRYTPLESLPKGTALSEKQKTFLQKLSELLTSKNNWKPDELQQELFTLSKEVATPKESFAALYQIFIGKNSGPRAGWFVLSMDKKFVSKRIQEALSIGDDQKIAESTESQLPDPNGYTVEMAVKKDFPGIFYAYTTIKGIKNEKKNSQLEVRAKEAVTQREGITTEEIGKIESIASYRKLLKATGTDWHSKRPSPEALLRRISQGKSLYSINVAVDAYNIAVIETGIGLGGFDLAHVDTPVSLRYSKAGETMHLLGDEAPTTLRDGQLIYADSTKALTMDLNYRDIDSTKITEQTTDIILFADGAPGLSQEDVTNALKQGAELIKEFCGGEIETIHIVE